VGSGRETSLNELFALLRDAAAALSPEAAYALLRHGPARPGDVRRSRADISRISAALGFAPAADFADALAETVRWYAERARVAAPV
jgi:nucleoside-diphosphate-sugar epimerase